MIKKMIVSLYIFRYTLISVFCAAAIISLSIVKSNLDMNRTARRIRKGSSENVSNGSSGVLMNPKAIEWLNYDQI